MTPIINPMWFYLIDVLETLDDLALWFSTFSVIGVIGFFLVKAVLWDVYYDEKTIDENYYKKYSKVVSKLLKGASIVFMLSTFIRVMVPTKETMYTMMVVDQITTDNIEGVEETIKDSVDYIYCKFNDCNYK